MEPFKKYQPELVLHLSAQPIVSLSYDQPKMIFDTKVGGPANLFEAVSNIPSVKVLDIVTSDKCYEYREWLRGYRENAHLRGIVSLDGRGCYSLANNAIIILGNIPLNPSRKRKLPRIKMGRSAYFVCYNICQKE